MTAKYKESLNNPNLLVQNKEDEDRQKGIERRWKDDSARGNLIKFCQYKVTYGTRASVVNVSDIHGISSNSARTKMILGKDGFIDKTVTNWVCPGEIIDANVEGHHLGSATESKANPNEEIELMDSLIAPIANKCLAMSGATHDDPEFAQRLKGVYLAPTRQLAKKYGIPYGIRAVFTEFLMPVYRGNAFMGYKSSWAITLHGDGSASAKRLTSSEKTFNYAMMLVEQINKKYNTKITPDWVFGGHFHSDTALDKKVVRTVYNAKGKATGSYAHTVRVRSGGSLKNKDSDSFNSNFYGEFDNNAMVYNWYLEENRNFNPNGDNEESRFTVKPTEFAVLNKRSNTFTPQAQEYMKVRKDENIYNKIKTETEKKSIVEIVDSFEGREI